ncbi:hypothetical protein AURDEDRAFT_168449 [Auricularia subglabra TFB-10046 SS5]|nr:hypothetical protein AURDEDRAFT_168449 [Auricularia subglabra TFB-10046 SS5]
MSAPTYDQPETWMPRFVGLFRSDLDGRWVDISETKWADGWTDASSFTLVNATLNPAAGVGGAMYFLNQLQGVMEPLHAASTAASPTQPRTELFARLKRTLSSTSRASDTPSDLQSLTYEGKFPDDDTATMSTLVGSTGPSSPKFESRYRRAKNDASHPFPTHRREARPPHSRYPFAQDWPTVEQPCVIHLQCVTREVHAFMTTKDPWLAKHFSIVPGFGAEAGGGWPAHAPYGNLTLVSRAMSVRGRPFILDYPNSHPAVCAHAVFVVVRLCTDSGHYRHVLLCNSMLEPPEGAIERTGEQTQQMRALTSWLFMDDSTSGSWSGFSLHAGVFSGRVKRDVRDEEPGYELSDATSELQYLSGGRILHTGPRDLCVKVGTMGFTADERNPKPLAVAAHFSFAPGPHLNMERTAIE